MSIKKCTKCRNEFEAHFLGLLPWKCPVCRERLWDDGWFDHSPPRPAEGLPEKDAPADAASVLRAHRRAQVDGTERAVMIFKWSGRLALILVCLLALWFIVFTDWRAATVKRNAPSPNPPASTAK